MQRSTDRILTTHVGSLIRPEPLRQFLSAKEAGRPFDRAAYAACLKASVAEVVQQQADVGIDVISDGEFGKAISWASIRCSGSAASSGGRSRPAAPVHPRRRPDAVRRVLRRPIPATGSSRRPLGRGSADHLHRPGRAATGHRQSQSRVAQREGRRSLPAGRRAHQLIPDRKNEHYANDDELQQAVGEAMRTEYRMIIDAGFLVQLDDARAAVSYDRTVPPKSLRTTVPGSPSRSRSPTTPSPGCRAKKSAITSAGGVGRDRTCPTCRSRTSPISC